MWRYLRLARPHFLVGGAVLFALGAFSTHGIDAMAYAVGQAMVTSIQLTAQLANEYADAEADAAVTNRTLFSGGSGVIPSGALPARAALVGAIISSTMAAIAIVAMAWISVPTAATGTVALLVAWVYSTPPVRLLSTGWGEVATSLVVAGLVPLVGVWSQGGRVGAGLWWAVAALVPIHVAMILCFELPDLDSDAATAKRVLAVRIGRRATHRLIVVCAAGAGMLLGFAARFDGRVPFRLAAVAGLGLTASAVAVGIRSRWWSVVTTGAVGSLVVVAGALLAGT